MAVEASPTLTSTSNTLTALQTMAAISSNGSNNAQALLDRLQSGKRHAFLQPEAAIPNESLHIVKDTLEAFASQVSEQQQERLKESRKRKRGGEQEEVLKIRKVYIDGFETNQVWEQAKRIIGSVLRHADAALQEIQDEEEIALNNESDDSQSQSDDAIVGADDLSLDSEADDNEDEEEASGIPDSDAEEEWEDASEGLGGEVDDYNEDEDENEDQNDDEEQEDYIEDPDGLNDGFFSLSDFNRQSQWFEQQDAKGDPNTDAASDDEEIDWNANPLSASTEKPTSSKPKKLEDDDEMVQSGDEDDDDEEDGPTFGNMDLDAPEGASDDEDFGDEEAEVDDGMDFNANDIYYKDFFAPPRKKRTNDKPKKSVAFKPQEPDEADITRAMADVRRDLFEDESEGEEGSEDDMSGVDAGDPKSRRSAHERRQAKLSDEIRKLEAASVAKREWTLSGEAAAADRPMNSLLEEDLDFEYVGKPVPVITPEVTESIEDMIKRRILAQEFDEVIKRRPEMESVPAGTRRGALEEVDDTKGKSLAEVYEEEHARKNDPDNYVSKSDEKLQREEREIEKLWRDVSARLDALSSWHYRPKPVEPTLSVVADVATVAMEDAQPTTAQGVAGQQSNMAPQEVYTASNKTAEKGEVVSKSGIPLAKQELSREDKTRRRRREKERVRKAGGVAPGKTLSGRAKMQKDTLTDLKKGGVKVINRKGEVTDVDGKKVKAAKAVSSGSYKL